MRHLLSSLLLTLLFLTPLRATSPAAAVVLSLADAQRLPPEVRVRTRYLTQYSKPEETWEEFGKVLRFQGNSLSRRADLTPPRQIAPDLFAVDIAKYAWEVETWEKLATIDPYFHQSVERVVKTETDRVKKVWPGGPDKTGKVFPKGLEYEAEETREVKEQKVGSAPWLLSQEEEIALRKDKDAYTSIRELIRLTQSEAPIVRADWWFVQTSRQLSIRNVQTGVGYYDWLGIKSRDDLFKIAKFSEKDSIEIEAEIRAALDVSGVSQQNRQIVRFRALTGPVWITLDVDNESGKGNATVNLKRGDYKHKAEEIYIFGRNGLPVYFLGDQNGVRQDSAPDFIGPDDSPGRIGKDGRIHVMKSCVGCHDKDVLKPIDDWARRTYTGRDVLQDPVERVRDELRRQYLSDLGSALKQDRQAFTDAIRAACELEPGVLAPAYTRHYNAYVEEPVTLPMAARELGYSPEHFVAALRGARDIQGKLHPDLVGFTKVPPTSLRRVKWEDVYGVAMTHSRGYVFP